MMDKERLAKYLAAKRNEYEYYKAQGKETVAEVIRQSVIKTVKLHKVKIQPGEQQTLF